MCIRAIDYCPPVGITFGDYLRAIVTADHDLNPDDVYGYRLAFIESFRAVGESTPEGMRSMSIEGLLWPTGGMRPQRKRSVWLNPRERYAALFTGEKQHIEYPRNRWR